MAGGKARRDREFGSTHARVASALARLDGKAWIEIVVEVHDAYSEAPFFVLIAPEASPLEAHRQFWSVLEPELGGFGDLRPTVSYSSVAEDGAVSYGFFSGETEMQRALDPEGWSAPCRRSADSMTLFRTVRDAKAKRPAKIPGRKPRR